MAISGATYSSQHYKYLDAVPALPGSAMEMSNRTLNPTATTRVSIQWDNEPPEERTSTLVLTAPSGIFVDLRIFADDIPSVSNAHELQSSSAIDWAFAGLAFAKSNPYDAPLTDNSWIHWLDSREVDALSVRDTGVSSTLPNGDTRERGEMKDASGALRVYEEVWRDVRVEPTCVTTPTTTAVFIRFRDGSEAATRGVCVRVEDINPVDVCGVLVRMGRWCQGVLRDVHGFTAERWELQLTEGTSETECWRPIFRSGLGYIPCIQACTSPLSSGQEEALDFSAPDGIWKRVELYETASNSNSRD
ncbi:uncharacterized protein FOMMEDRAFT_113416 [Fomitiporia mediterranea MF3/22]|uniref:uncharacterized protein n=1 Tax=Fomitiporia mediterranea (strain MF3/22) TaxID=694068 RepID=UPI00044094B8|nr:uncharacterized protein FOMMEDRAFT_113416 [Fomitiporia mediterranea MF3/22]EJC98866.1 hypothetical protein FOMMEDRAFT_113416 [Fomitiporia mediterranea MF3/22]